MIFYKVKRGEPLILTPEQEIEITGFIRDIVLDKGYILLAYNMCRDHVHSTLVCEEVERDQIVGRLKGKSTHLYKQAHNIKDEFHLWAQKYNPWEIRSEKQLVNTIEYIRYNRRRHNLPPNRGLRPIVMEMIKTLDDLKDLFSETK